MNGYNEKKYLLRTRKNLYNVLCYSDILSSLTDSISPHDSLDSLLHAASPDDSVASLLKKEFLASELILWTQVSLNLT